MRVVIQRVTRASVSINGQLHSTINKGMLILLGVEHEDGEDDIQWLVRKIAGLRIFDDSDGVMNIDIRQDGGGILVVSQFTLHASTRKGNRPSYIKAAGEQTAVPLYEKFVTALQSELGKPVSTGVFGADMQVELINDGPVTIIIDSKIKE